jgi:hypothetical protein
MTDKAFALAASWRDAAPYSAEFGPFLARLESTTSAEGGRTEEDGAAAAAAASCYCGRVRYQTRGEPLSSKLCHCRGCQLLHGAPFEWVAIFEKEDVKFDPASLEFLYFYSSELDRGWTADRADQRVLPVKVSCSHCRTPVADEGRHMWLAYCPLFGFSSEAGIPESFRHSCHLFYSQRCIDLPDDQTKWTGHRNKSPEWKG